MLQKCNYILVENRKNPKLQVSKELNIIVDLLKQTDKESFEGALNDWFLKWEAFFSERSINEKTGKSHIYD
jgi:hypothetical protein